jgi:pSer/pThr/pTyr-binding forkhead associated (FHA) protein
MDKNSEEVSLLVAQAGPLNGQRWAISDTLLIGRDPSCDIIIVDRQVSRHHARLIQTSSGIRMEDLESKNGTHLNGKPLKAPSILQDGDNIQIALAQKFIFISADATIPLTTGATNHPTDVLPNIDKSTGYFQAGEDDGDQQIPGRLHLEKRSRRVWISLVERDKSPGRKNAESRVKDVEIDPPLSASQFRLLELLYDQQGRVIPRQELITSVWGVDQAIGVSEQALDALIRRLRDRLASIDPTHPYIVTIRGHGLRLDNPPVSSMP